MLINHRSQYCTIRINKNIKLVKSEIQFYRWYEHLIEPSRFFQWHVFFVKYSINAYSLKSNVLLNFVSIYFNVLRTKLFLISIESCSWFNGKHIVLRRAEYLLIESKLNTWSMIINNMLLLKSNEMIIENLQNNIQNSKSELLVYTVLKISGHLRLL